MATISAQVPCALAGAAQVMYLFRNCGHAPSPRGTVSKAKKLV